MTTEAPVLFEGENLSLVWGKLFLYTMANSSRALRPAVVSIGNFPSPLPTEDESVRTELDATLSRLKKVSCDVSAMMIFPRKIWLRREKPSCKDLKSLCVDRLMPRLRKRDQRNRNGTYFSRMMDFEGSKKGRLKNINQLEFVVDLLKSRKRRPRHSALQVACFDPAKDHTRQPVRGFPCLQQVSFAYDNEGGLAVNGFYPTQYIFDRAYGNYLGLCHLGEFVAHETGLKFCRMTCFIGHPELGSTTKGKLRSLEEVVKAQVS